MKQDKNSKNNDIHNIAMIKNYIERDSIKALRMYEITRIAGVWAKITIDTNRKNILPVSQAEKLMSQGQFTAIGEDSQYVWHILISRSIDKNKIRPDSVSVPYPFNTAEREKARIKTSKMTVKVSQKQRKNLKLIHYLMGIYKINTTEAWYGRVIPTSWTQP